MSDFPTLFRGTRRTLEATALIATLTLLSACEEENDPTVMATEEAVYEGADQPDMDEMDRDRAAAPPPRTAIAGQERQMDTANPVAGDDTVSLAGAAGTEAIRVTRNGPDEVRVGEPFTYELEVENASDIVAHGVVLRERMPEGMIINARQRRAPVTQPDQGQEAGPGVHRLGTLQPGETRTIPVQAVARAEGSMDLCFSVEFDQAMCSTITAVQPELRLERYVANDTPFICEDLEVRYVLRNTGTGETSDAVIMEDLPEGLMFRGEQQVRLEAGTLAAGETYEETVLLEASRAGSFTGSARATTGDLEVSSSESSLTVLRPELQITIDGPGQHYVGWPASHDVTVTNTSENAPAQEAVLELPMLEEMNRVSVSPARYQREGSLVRLGTIEPGGTRTVSIDFQVADPRNVQITAQANAYCAQATQARTTTAFEGIPALRIEVVDLRDPVPVGETTAYELRVKNQGSAEDVNVQLTATLPEQMSFIGGDGDSDVTADGQTINFGAIDRLPPGEIATWRIEVQADDAGDVRLKVDLQSQAHAKSISEQEPTTLFNP